MRRKTKWKRTQNEGGILNGGQRKMEESEIGKKKEERKTEETK
jgi:hypothetical protein